MHIPAKNTHLQVTVPDSVNAVEAPRATSEVHVPGSIASAIIPLTRDALREAPKGPSSLQFAMQVHQRWNSPHATRARAAAGLEGGAMLRLPLEPKFLARWSREIAEIEQFLTGADLATSVVPAEHQGWAEDTRAQMLAHVVELKQRVDKLAEAQPNGAPMKEVYDAVHAFTCAADMEVIFEHILHGSDGKQALNAQLQFRMDQPWQYEKRYDHEHMGHLIERTLIPLAPAVLLFPTFDAFDRTEFPAATVWPLQLVRGWQNFDRNKGELPSRFVSHDIFHARMQAYGKLRNMGIAAALPGRNNYLAKADEEPPLRHFEVDAVNTRSRREQAVQSWWLRRADGVGDTKLREMIQIILFLHHELPQFRAGKAYREQGMQALLGPDGASFTHGASFTSEEVPELVERAREWFQSEEKARAEPTVFRQNLGPVPEFAPVAGRVLFGAFPLEKPRKGTTLASFFERKIT